MPFAAWGRWKLCQTFWIVFVVVVTEFLGHLRVVPLSWGIPWNAANVCERVALSDFCKIVRLFLIAGCSLWPTKYFQQWVDQFCYRAVRETVVRAFLSCQSDAYLTSIYLGFWSSSSFGGYLFYSKLLFISTVCCSCLLQTNDSNEQFSYFIIWCLFGLLSCLSRSEECQNVVIHVSCENIKK